jgi:isopentenyldiphosphate isomerase
VIHEDVELEDGCALHVSFFGLKFDRKGELQVTDRRTTKSYAVPRHLQPFSHAAFWM